jgi:hypothetical protein
LAGFEFSLDWDWIRVGIGEKLGGEEKSAARSMMREEGNLLGKLSERRQAEKEASAGGERSAGRRGLIIPINGVLPPVW